MENSILIHPLKADSADIQNAIQLYLDAFPSCERRETTEWVNCIAQTSKEPFTLFGIYLNEEFAGFITAWEFAGFVYLEHFAVLACTRGNGVGAQTMQLVKEYYQGLPLVLEVEPPTEGMTVRRVGFYQRQGYQLSERAYQQPPYRKEDEWFALKLMTTQPNYLETHFEEVKQAIYENVYHVK